MRKTGKVEKQPLHQNYNIWRNLKKKKKKERKEKKKKGIC